MASSSTSTSSSPSFFFSDAGRKEKENVPKAIENPLLLRSPPARPDSNNHYGSNASDNGNSSNLHGGALTVHSQNGEMGLRQRKAPQRDDSFGPPPRASLSMGTVVDFMPPTKQDAPLWEKSRQTESRLMPSTTGCWVLIYGYANANHYQEIIRRFTGYGHVLDRRGRSNWVALQYESRLQAEKALCHRDLQLADGIFCGVKRLDDNDPILLQAADNSLSGLWTLPKEPLLELESESPLMINGGGVTTNNNGNSKPNGVLEEKDILLLPGDQTRTKGDGRKASLCEKVLRWLLSIDA